MNDNERQVNKEKEKVAKKATLSGVVCSNHGEHYQPVFKRVFDKDANVNFVKQVDKTNLYQFIQDSKSQTDLAILEKRFIELGEIPNVDPSLGSNDFTTMPTNIHEVYKMANDISANFNSLPESIRNIFGSVEAYQSALLDGTYQSTLVKAINEMNKQKQEEKKEGNE